MAVEIVDPFADALEDEPDPEPAVVTQEPVETPEVAPDDMAVLKAMAAKLGVTVVEPGAVPVTVPVPGVVSNLTPEEKARQHADALSMGARESRIEFDSTKPDESSETILFHFTEDGFTALNKMWYRGEELEFIIIRDVDGKPIGSPAYLATLDREGNSWVHMFDNPRGQFAAWGKTMMAPGPWPGNPLPDTIQCGCVDDANMAQPGSVCRECNNTRVISTDKAAEAIRKRARRPPVPMDDAIMRGVSSRR